MSERQKILAVVGLTIIDGSHILLVRKKRPKFQCGLLNGPGGKVEPGEEPVEAMIREFYEETSIKTDKLDWEMIVNLDTPDWQVIFYRSFMSQYDTLNMKPLPPADEELVVVDINTLHEESIMRNLRWLIPFCLDDSSYQLPIEITET